MLVVSVALTFGLSGLGLLFFGPEGFRTKPLTTEVFRFGSVIVTSQTLLMVASAAVFSLLLFLFFEHTLAGKALRATAINRRGRAHCRHPPGELGGAGVFARIAAWRDFRHFDQPGDDALLQFRLHHRS